MWQVEKSTRRNRRASRRIDHYYDQVPDVNGVNRTVKRRGDYFRVLRADRQVIKILNETPPPDTLKKRDRRLISRIYYRTLPKLFTHLSYGPDLRVLWAIEEFYYMRLNKISLSRHSPRRVYRLSKNVCFNFHNRMIHSIELKN